MLTARQAADQIGVSVWRVYQLIEAKQLKARRFGRDWSISPVSVSAFARKPRKRGKPFAKPEDIKAASVTRRKYVRTRRGVGP